LRKEPLRGSEIAHRIASARGYDAKVIYKVVYPALTAMLRRGLVVKEGSVWRVA